VNLKKSCNFSLLILLLFIGIANNIAADDEIVLISNPQPTHVEKNYKRLVKVAEIPIDFSDNHYFAIPAGIAVSDQELFVLDGKINQVFLFTKDFKFVKPFVTSGNGPGEIDPRTMFEKYIYFAENGTLYLSDPGNKKITVFNRRGKFIKDTQIPFDFPGSVIPVVDSDGNFYLTSRDSVLSVYDKNMKKIKTLLKPGVLRRFLCTKHYSFLTPCTSNTSYDVLPGNRLVVYIANAATVYIFKDFKLERKFDVWPKRIIKQHTEEIEEVKKHSEGRSFFAMLFNKFFVDKDDRDFFYLNGPVDIEKNVRTLYKFNLKGELISVLYTEIKKVDIMAKRSNLFYGISFDGEILIFKEE
jgi:hypothetical protein